MIIKSYQNKTSLVILFVILFTGSCEDPNNDESIFDPNIKIIFPSNNSIVSDTVIFDFDINDENLIVRIDLYINNDSTDISDNSDPFSINWITKNYQNGNYSAFIKAYDSLGNSSNSDTIQLILDNFLIFNKTFGIPDNNEDGYSIIETSDQGYAVLGNTGSENKDISLLKVDSLGNQIWVQSYGGSQYDEARHFQETFDGGFIISGVTKSYGYGEEDIWIIKTNASGLIDWNVNFGEGQNDRGAQILQTDEGGYIIIGEKYNIDFENSDLWLLKINSQGELSWEKTLGSTGDDRGYDIKNNRSGGYLLLGSTNSFGNGGSDIWLINTDSEGNEIWSKTYGSSNNEYGRSIIDSDDGGYLIFATSESFGNDNTGLHNIKIDSTGLEEWNKSFGGFYGKNGNVVRKSPNGGYILISSRYNFNDNSYNMWLIKMDSNGSTEWTKTFGDSNNDYGFGIAITSDNGFILTGSTSNYGNSSSDLSDIWVIKTNLNGETLDPN